MQNTEQFQNAFRRVKQIWLETKELWLDSTAEEFERDYWLPLEVEAQQLFKVLDSLELVLSEKV
jgi:hypothetical protein